MHSPAMTDRADALAERLFAATLGALELYPFYLGTELGLYPTLADAHELPTEWLAALPDVVARLESARHPRIADLGCGQGFSTIALAHAFLDAHVDGIDADPASITDARRHARDAGLDGRVRFLHADVTELAGPYDLILILEAVPAALAAVALPSAAQARDCGSDRQRRRNRRCLRRE
jgi:SAM-dependent methyltransferase